MKITTLLESATIPPEIQVYRKQLAKDLPEFRVGLVFSPTYPAVKKIIDLLNKCGILWNDGNRVELLKEDIEDLMSTYPAIVIKTPTRTFVSVPVAEDPLGKSTGVLPVVYSAPLPADLEKNYDSLYYRYYMRDVATNNASGITLNCLGDYAILIPVITTSKEAVWARGKFSWGYVIDNIRGISSAKLDVSNNVDKLKEVIGSLGYITTAYLTGFSNPIVAVDVNFGDARIIRIYYEVRSSYVRLVAVGDLLPHSNTDFKNPVLWGAPLDLNKDEDVDTLIRQLDLIRRGFDKLYNTYKRDIGKVLKEVLEEENYIIEYSPAFLEWQVQKKQGSSILSFDRARFGLAAEWSFIDESSWLQAKRSIERLARKFNVIADTSKKKRIRLFPTPNYFKGIYDKPEKVLREARREFVKNVANLLKGIGGN